ncbi:hypothetical protein H5T88_05200 [bacterium]|nr:hypothetical protein [bacterium]
MFKKLNIGASAIREAITICLYCLLMMGLFLVGSYNVEASDAKISKILSQLRKVMESPELEIVVSMDEGYVKGPNGEIRQRSYPADGGRVRFYTDSSGKWRYESGDSLVVYDGKYWWKYSRKRNVFSKKSITSGFANFTKQTYKRALLTAFTFALPFNDDPLQKGKPWDFNKATVKWDVINGRKALLLVVPSFKEAFETSPYSADPKEREKRTGTMTFNFKVWADPKTYLPIAIQVEMKMEKVENPEFKGCIEVHSLKIHKLSFNPAIKKDMFIFVPPKGAKEINPAEWNDYYLKR